ncbi:MAG: glycogen synthase [Campylobacterales bacterium]|nr:glycogen synthase [Campylobacterales bacterium]
MTKRILFAASEVYPFAKTGGLADVAHSLPRALKNSYDSEVILPLYRSIAREEYSILPIGEPFILRMGDVDYSVEMYGCTYEGIVYRFVYSPLLCDREFLYGTAQEGYADNAVRFGLFSYAIMALLKEEQYAIVHLNDWQCALVALLVHDDLEVTTKTLYTIHNLAYQGLFEATVLKELGISDSYFTHDTLEFYGKVNFMKAGIAYANTITTVSPTYAKEILTPEAGCGLEGFLQCHRHKLTGILNGIDTEHFSPTSDRALVAPYTNVKGKKPSKSDLLKQLGLKGVTKPLFVFIGRFVSQKGVDLLIETLPKIAAMECNIALLGEGEEQYYEKLCGVIERQPNIRMTFGYEESFAHRMYAAADFLLMPSLFEPCGLNQMIAFAYGAIPIVHRVGGLADSVERFETYTHESSEGYGVVFFTPTPRSLLLAVRKSCDLYKDKKLFDQISNHNMQCDFSWDQSAKSYITLYDSLTIGEIV